MLVNGAIREAISEGDAPHQAAADIAEQLSKDGPDALDISSADRRERAVRMTVEASLRRLDEAQRDRYLELAIIPEDTVVPAEVIEFLWQTTGGLAPAECRRLWRTLVDRSLLTKADGTLRLHDVLRAYLAKTLGSVRLTRTNALLVEAVRVHDAQDWKHAHPYFLRNLARHAVAAGELDSLLTDPGFLLNASQLELLACVADARTDAGKAGAVVYQRVAHHLRDDYGDERISQLELAARRAAATELADATTSLTPSRQWACTWAHWQSETPHKILARHDKAVDHVDSVVLPDGRVWVISSSVGGPMHIVDLVTNQVVDTEWASLEAPCSHFEVVAGPDDSPAVLVSDWSGVVGIWDLLSGEPLNHRIPRKTASVRTAKWVRQSNGEPIAVLSYIDGTIRAWDPWSGEQVGRTIPAAPEGNPYMRIFIADVLSDGRTAIVTADGTQPVRVWDLNTGDRVGKGIVMPQHRVSQLHTWRPSGGGPVVLTASDSRVDIWDLHTGDRVGERLFDAGPGIGAVVCTRLPDGRDVVITSAGQGDIRIWDWKTRRAIGGRLTGHPGSINTMTCTRLPDGRPVLITGGNENTVRAWDLMISADPPARSIVPVSSAGLAGSLAITGHRDGSTSFWDMHAGRELQRVNRSLKSRPTEVLATACIETEKHRVLTISGIDRQVVLWTGAAQERTVLGYHEGDVLSATCARLPDGRLVAATGDTDAVIQFWNLTARAADGHVCLPVNDRRMTRSDMVTALTHTTMPDRRVAHVTGQGDGTIRLWDFETHQPIGKPMIRRDPRQVAPARISAIACVPLADGRIIAVAGSADTTQDTVVAWDLLTSKPIAVTTVQTGWVKGIVCTTLPDGSAVAVTGDEVLRIWSLDILNGSGSHEPVLWKPLREIDIDAPVTALASGPGCSVLVGTSHGMLRLRLDKL
ncbi:WD40 repeat domain-containing protein [Kibdelosporangium aridum]|uniref:WD40 repeat domain-containing protein n=1 Tax=Kibdelosporangium aridum TaxID=2030 RepID=UPI0035E5791B